jgi:hypothetical protein
VKIPENFMTAAASSPNPIGALQAQILGYSDGQWPKFATAVEIRKATGVDEAKILKYAKDGLCPHVRLDGKIFFMKSHIIRWLRENVLQIHEGKSLESVPVLVNRVEPKDVPRQLHLAAKRLIEVQHTVGVYFLCDNDEVVYVGQSIDVGSRIRQHTDKVFSRAFCLPCPEEDLNRVEAAFISLFKPKYNGGKNRRGEDALIHSSSKGFHGYSEVIKEFFGEEAA